MPMAFLGIILLPLYQPLKWLAKLSVMPTALFNPHYALENLLQLQTASKSVAILHFSLSP